MRAAPDKSEYPDWRFCALHPPHLHSKKPFYRYFIIAEECSNATIWGGGTIEDINVSDLVVDTNCGNPFNRPVMIDLGPRPKGFVPGLDPADQPEPGPVRGVSIENVSLRTDGRILLHAMDGRRDGRQAPIYGAHERWWWPRMHRGYAWTASRYGGRTGLRRRESIAPEPTPRAACVRRLQARARRLRLRGGTSHSDDHPAAGIPDQSLDGRSLYGPVLGTTESRDSLLFEFHGLRALYSQRTLLTADGRKYVFTPGDFDELYDLKRDPMEMRNLLDELGRPRSGTGIAPSEADELREKLADWAQKAGDPLGRSIHSYYDWR